MLFGKFRLYLLRYGKGRYVGRIDGGRVKRIVFRIDHQHLIFINKAGIYGGVNK